MKLTFWMWHRLSIGSLRLVKIENEPRKYKENSTLFQPPPYLYLGSVYMNLPYEIYYLLSETWVWFHKSRWSRNTVKNLTPRCNSNRFINHRVPDVSGAPSSFPASDDETRSGLTIDCLNTANLPVMLLIQWVFGGGGSFLVPHARACSCCSLAGICLCEVSLCEKHT